MKKRLSTLLAAILAIGTLFAFTACGEPDGKTPQTHVHSFQHTAAQSATCTETGNVEYWFCSGCKTYYSDENGKRELTTVTVPALGHTFDDWRVVQKAACTEDGTKTVYCSVCGDEGKTEAIPKNGHSYGDWTVTKEPNCTEEGSRYRVCSVCKDKDTQAIPANGHSYGDWTVTKAPTCSEEGSRYHVCSVCKQNDTEVIPATEKHVYDINNFCKNCEHELEYTKVGLEYDYSEQMGGYFVSAADKTLSGDIVIPCYYQWKPVVAISGNGFSGCRNITSVIIPETVTTINSGAFSNCDDLTSVTIPSSVEVMRSGTFQECTNLATINYSGDLASWCQVCLLGVVMTQKLTLYINGEKIEGDVIIPDGVTRIGYGAFYATGITGVTIPDSVEIIENDAFIRCNLTSITFKGTKAQWNAIEKEVDWDLRAGDYTIHCTDGDIEK